MTDLFSYRKRVAAGDPPDVFVYDELPKGLRIQIIHIWRDAIGPFYLSRGRTNPDWKEIHNIVAREHGVLMLGKDHHPDHHRAFDSRCETYLISASAVDDALDLIEASFMYLDEKVRRFSPSDRGLRGIKMTASAAIEELNTRFRRAGVGYQFEAGQLFRVDSELIHSEVVRPTLRYLHQKGFEGPRDEFLQAHAHYRAGETKDAITDANNALESTLKTICDQQRWQYAPGARVSDLLKVVRENGLLPDYLDASFDQLVATLKSGLPKVRNEVGAHGQGAAPRETPDYVAAYALHLAAAKILFLVEAHKEMK